MTIDDNIKSADDIKWEWNMKLREMGRGNVVSRSFIPTKDGYSIHHRSLFKTDDDYEQYRSRLDIKTIEDFTKVEDYAQYVKGFSSALQEKLTPENAQFVTKRWRYLQGYAAGIMESSNRNVKNISSDLKASFKGAEDALLRFMEGYKDGQHLYDNVVDTTKMNAVYFDKTQYKSFQDVVKQAQTDDSVEKIVFNKRKDGNWDISLMYRK
jgi:hypothetical protein